MKTAAQTSQELREEWMAAKANPRFIFGYGRYGDGKQWVQLDELTGGLQTNNLAALVALPKDGKSMLAAAWVPIIAEQADEVGEVVRVITLETSRQTYQRRMAALMAGIKEPKNIKRGMLSVADEKKYLSALDWLEGLPIEYLDNKDLTDEQALQLGNSPISFDNMAQFVSGVSMQAVKRGSAVELPPQRKKTYWWLLDHVGLLSDLRNKNNRTWALYDLADQLADLAHRYATGLFITHLNREAAGSGNRPTLSNIGGSDQIGRNCDQIFTLWRPWKDASEEDRAAVGATEAEPVFLIFQSRDEGSGVDTLVWQHEYASYTELVLGPGVKLPSLLPQTKKKK